MIFRRVAAAILLSLALAACAELIQSEPGPAARQELAAQERNALFDTEIVIARVEVMQDQTRLGLEILGIGTPGIPDAETVAEREPYRRLYDTVGRYNALRQSACAVRVTVENVCGGAPYLPLWYAGRARPDTTANGLKKMAEEMQDRMTQLWDGVCMRARAKSGDEHLCAIE